ncbi:MAG: YtxH domain-containing protein [Pseudonocardiales bacterium]
MRKLTFIVGFGAGYLLGTRDGRARYEQIRRSVREVADNPAVQETAGVVQAQAMGLISKAQEKVSSLTSGERSSSRHGTSDGAGSNGFVR